MNANETFMYSLAQIPMKPAYVGYSHDQDDILAFCKEVLKDVAGHDLSKYVTSYLNDETLEFYVQLDDYTMQDELGEATIEAINEELGFNLDEYWELARYCYMKAYNINTWIYLQGTYDSDSVDIQIGIPRDL